MDAYNAEKNTRESYFMDYQENGAWEIKQRDIFCPIVI